MQVKLNRDWRTYRAGRILATPDGVGNVLIKRGIAAPVDAADEPKPKKARKSER